LSGQQTILLDRYSVPRGYPFSFTVRKHVGTSDSIRRRKQVKRAK